MDFSTFKTSKYFKTIVALGSILVVSFIAFVTIQLATGGQYNQDNILKLASTKDLTILGYELENPRDHLQRASQFQQIRFPFVTIPSQGTLRGTVLKSRLGRDYYAFYKVPYAKPPIGELRFELPQEPKRWYGVRDATIPGPECIQRAKYITTPTPSGEEDCLFVNIYTPKLSGSSSEAKLPVMVYFHGGGGPFGNGTRYGAKYFMDEDVVLITVEFRIGILRTFTSGTADYPGNIGAKDQVASLKWVQKNVAQFSGDPTRVMIFGNSGGAVAVHSLILSDMAKGLFHTAVLQSGNSIRRFGYIEDADANALTDELAMEVGCEEYLGNSKELVKCLRSIDAKNLVLTQVQEKEVGSVKEPIPANGDTSNTFFTDYPWNLVQQGKIHAIPIIVGDVSEESMSGDFIDYLLNENATKELDENFEELLPSIIDIPPTKSDPTMAKKFREVYFGDRTIGNDTRIELIQLYSDSWVHSQRVAALLHSRKTNQPVYLYWLTKQPAKTYGQRYEDNFPPPYGVNHADELQYFFLYDGYPEIPVDSPWFNFSKTVVKMWVDFAATGQPVSPTNEWKPIDPVDNGMKWFELGDNFREVEPVTERMLLWDEYIPVLYEP